MHLPRDGITMCGI